MVAVPGFNHYEAHYSSDPQPVEASENISFYLPPAFRVYVNYYEATHNVFRKTEGTGLPFWQQLHMTEEHGLVWKDCQEPNPAIRLQPVSEPLESGLYLVRTDPIGTLVYRKLNGAWDLLVVKTGDAYFVNTSHTDDSIRSGSPTKLRTLSESDKAKKFAQALGLE